MDDTDSVTWVSRYVSSRKRFCIVTLGGAPAWVTSICWLTAPGAAVDTVMRPVLWTALGLVLAVTVKLPLLVPLDGDTLSHDCALLATDTFHGLVDSTLTLSDLCDAGALHTVGFITNTGGEGCVTVNVRVIPPPVTVIVPVLELEVAFCCTPKVIEPFPVRLKGE